MSRIYSLDYLKFILACFVAFGHSGLIQNHLTVASFVLGNGILRNAVPVFSVVSGYFFYMAVTKGRALVWLRRVLVLYLIWMAFYAPVWMGHVHGLRDFARTMIYGYMHLWYVIGLFVAGCVMVALLRLGRAVGLGRKPMIVAAVLCALAGVVMEYLIVTGTYDIAIHRYRNGLFIIFPFAAIGYLVAARVSHRGLDSLPPARTMAALSALAVLAMMFESWVVAMVWSPVERSFLEMPATSLPAGAAIFLLTLRLNLPRPAVDLGFLSASIYFLHVAVELFAATRGVRNEWVIFILGVTVPIVIGLIFRQVMAMFGAGRRADRA